MSIKFQEQPQQAQVKLDRMYVFEATLNAGERYEDIGALVEAAARGIAAVDVDFIGAIQKPALTLSAKLEKLWLVFKESTNTTSGSYAIVADLKDAEFDFFHADVLGPLAALIPDDAKAVFRAKRIVYSHNLNPDISGTSGQNIFGFDDDAIKAGNLVLDWPFHFTAGMALYCDFSFAGTTTDFQLVYGVPVYTPEGRAGKPDEVSTLVQQMREEKGNDEKALKEVDKALAEKSSKALDKLEGDAKSTQPGSTPKKLDTSQRRGPVSLDSLIVTFKGMSVEVDVIAGIQLGPLAGKIIDFQVELFLDDLTNPRFGLDGIGLAYESPAVSIAGALLKQEMPYEAGERHLTATAYNGGLILKTPAVGFFGIASFAEIEVEDHDHERHDELSLFVYAMLQAKTGLTILGIITINGLAVTGGYNRDFLVPSDTGDIPDHPLIALVEAGGPPKSEDDKEDDTSHAADAGSPSDAATTKPEKAAEPAFDAGGDLDALIGVLRKIKEYVPIKAHNVVLGVGLKANLAQLIDLFLMPVVSFTTDHKEVSLQLYGTASLTVPKTAEDGKAVLQLNAALAAEIPIRGDKKPLMIGLAITSGSYVLRPWLSIEGGLAFYRHKGVTVFTLGGYGPLYKGAKPGWPVATPVTISFHLDTAVSARVRLYFSLLPDAITFGFDLDGSAHVGGSHFSLDASFDAGVHALMMWAPFYYEIEAHANLALRVEASMKIGVGRFSKTISKSLSFDISAKMQIWGDADDKLNGSAELTIHLLFTFHPTIEWGEPRGNFQPITWKEFKHNFAPHPDGDENKLASGQCHITDGVLGHTGKDKIPLVTSDGFAADVKVFFPATESTLNDSELAWWPKKDVGIQMIGLTADDYSAPMTVELHRMDGPNGAEVPRDRLVLEPIKDDLPAALWKPARHSGMASPPDPNGPTVVDDVPVGLRIRSKPAVERASRAIDKQNLAFDIDEGPDIGRRGAGRVARGTKSTEEAVTSSMTRHHPDPGVLAALGIVDGDVSFARLKDTDLVGIPHLV